MEARRLLTYAVCVMACSGAGAAHAYDDRTTHPALTQEIVKAYNRTYPDDVIGDSEMGKLMRASSDEDQLPRPLNHLYDPVHGSGWSGARTGWIPAVMTRLASILVLLPEAPLSSVEWIDADSVQQAYARYGGNRSWQAGLRALAGGDRDQALKSLGTALHLLEDAGVPEHARDDTHVHQISFLTGDTGSPYEKYAARYDAGTIGIAASMTLRQQDVPRYARPADYVADNARYAAASFYSKDTVEDPSFPLPKVQRENGGIAYGRTPDGKEVPLARRVKTLSGDELRIGDDAMFSTIFEAQFRVMSERTVRLGVGLVRDFRTSPGGRSDAPVTRPLYSVAGEISNALDWAGGFVSGAVRSAAGQASRAYAWLAGPRNVGASPDPAAQATQDIGTVGEIATSGIGKASKPASGTTSTATSKPRNASSTSVAARCPATGAPRVAISEIAWMGTAANANDEWIEIASADQDAVNLEGWELRSDSGLYVDLSGVTLRAGEFAVLERTDDTTLPRVQAAAIYTGALPNAPPQGFTIELVSAGCGTIDKLEAGDGWESGDAASRRTMERTPSGGWQTSSLPGGTPGARNSSGFVKPRPTSTATSSIQEDDKDDEEVADQDQSHDEAEGIDQGSLIISEIQSAGVSASDEYIELYNPNARSVSLAGWSLQYFAATMTAVAQKRALPDARVPAHGYFLITREGTGSGDGYRGRWHRISRTRPSVSRARERR